MSTRLPAEVSPGLAPEAISKLEKVFRSIDTDGSGNITMAEFSKACKCLSLSLSKQDIDQFLASDVSGDQKLNFSEFCNFYVSRLRVVFKQIDTDNSGEISSGELQEAFKTLGYQVTEREVKVVLAEVDKDNSQTVDFNEFCSFFCSLPSPSVRAVMQQWSSGLAMDIGTDLAPPPLPPASVPIWHALLAGAVAGVISRTVTAPLEKIKLLAQTSSSGHVTLVKSFRSVVIKETWRGLFAGNGANCIRVMPFSALVCLAYSNMSKHFPLDKKEGSKWHPLWRMGTGASAGVFATLLTHPVDVVRARLTIQLPSEATAYKGLYDGLKTVARQEGMRGLYRGVGPTLLAIAPFMAVQQATYDVLKHEASSRGIRTSPLLFFTCGSLAGMAAQTVIYPLDVIRRRMQVESGSKTHSSLFNLIRSLTLREMFAGLTATYLKVMPAAAVSLLVRDAALGRLSSN